MVVSNFDVGAQGAQKPQALGRERLLGVPNVCEITGLAEATASKLMKETGRAIKVHGRLYILESSFFAYLHELEVTEPCAK